DGDSESPAFVSDTSFVGDIGERAVMVVMQEHGTGSGCFALERGKGRAIHEIDVEPTIVVIVEEGHAGARSFENGALFRAAHFVVKDVETGGVRRVDENDGSAIDKTTCGNRA